MAALSDTDLRTILGDDYLSKLATLEESSGISRRERDARKQWKSLEDKKFGGFSAVTMGLGLFVAGLITRDDSSWIQHMVAVGLVAWGIGVVLYLKRRQAALGSEMQVLAV